jgi:hypothetical protein
VTASRVARRAADAAVLDAAPRGGGVAVGGAGEAMGSTRTATLGEAALARDGNGNALPLP